MKEKWENENERPEERERGNKKRHTKRVRYKK